MSPASLKPTLDPGQTHRALARLRLLDLVILLGLLAVLAAAGWALAGAAGRADGAPGRLGPIIWTGLAALAALGLGSAILEITSARARRLNDLDRCAAAYLGGCAGAAALNLLAGALTVRTILANGVANGLWLLAGLCLCLNVVGTVLTLPRLRHLRSLHYRPTLPITRIR